MCQEKISGAETKVRKVIEDLEAEAGDGEDAAAG